MGTVRHLLLRFRNAASNSHRIFSSSAVAIRRPEAECSELEEEGDVYKRALKIQRPTTVECKNILYKYNHVSFIGTIGYPLRPCNSKNLVFYTSLEVKTASAATRPLWLFLIFWNEMAEISIRYLKPNDLVYVSGSLQSHLKNTENMKSKYDYQVNVTEVNFVAQHDRVKQEPKFSREDIIQRLRDRLHLWHIFFTSPDEWWDNRNDKPYPTAPDFKHKDTGEKLWLKHTDPPWIQQQLDLLDSRLSTRSSRGIRNTRLNLSPLFYDDPKGA